MTEEEYWQDLDDAIEAHSRAYNAMLKLRDDERAGTKKQAAALAAWQDAWEHRSAVLAAFYWTEEDGYLGEFKDVGPTLRRYYAAKYAGGQKK